MDSLRQLIDRLVDEHGDPRVGEIMVLSMGSFMLLNGIVHLLTPIFWKGYSNLDFGTQVNWCNRMVSVIHSAFVSPMTLRVLLTDKGMQADPMDGHSKDIVFYGSIVGAYFVYDIFWMFAFYVHLFEKDALFHHVLGLLCGYIGLVLQRMHMFGATLIVFLEITNPSLHFGWMIKQMRLEQHIVNLINGLVFVLSFFVFRVVMCTYYLYVMVMLAIEWNRPGDNLIYYGVVIYGSFALLNMMWFAKVWSMFRRKLDKYINFRAGSPTLADAKKID